MPSRMDDWRVEILDRAGNAKPGRVRATGGSLTWDANGTVSGTGRIQLTIGADTVLDMRTDRLRLTHVNRGVETACGIWHLAAPGRAHRAGRTEVSAILADATLPLSRQVGRWLSFAAGTVVVPAVVDILRGRGITAIQATASTEALDKPKTFQPTATWAEVVTELLKAIGYGPPRADAHGQTLVLPHIKPEDRQPTGTYGAEREQLRLLPEWDDQFDLSQVPTGVRIYVPRPGGQAGWIGAADLPDAHPLSAASRGEEILVTEQGDVNSSAKADALAQQRLAELVRITRVVPITHPIDGTSVGDIILLDLPELGAGGMRAEIVARTINLGVGPVVTSSMQWIYDGGSDLSWALR